MENGFLKNISASSFKSLFPNSSSRKHKTLMKSRTKLNRNSENTPPLDVNIQTSDPPLLPTSTFPRFSLSQPTTIRQDFTGSVVPAPSDPTVKVLVRIKPSEEGFQFGESIVKKVSHDSVSVVGNGEYRFDSVFDITCNQENLFQTVGVPLVTDALAGYNTILMAYGQSGSGKTYTMWGPPGALVGTLSSATDHQGIAPRVLRMLFTRIQQDKENTDGRQINYRCRCSFLEICNGQIGDLLDPTQTNLEIKDDAENGFYIKDLTEECVTGYEDVTKILIKGLSRRKVMATSTNSKSSRSHVIFTCIIDSWFESQGSSSKCFTSSKTTRLNLVDLAGFESIVLDDGALDQCLTNRNYDNKSPSQLRNLINALVKQSHQEISQGISFLKESLGGNGKLTIICTIIPDKKFSNEAVSILKFGEHIKRVENHPVMNEITESNVNCLPGQIRQLKEELIRAKSDSISVKSNPNGLGVRESLNQLRLDLNRSLIIPSKDDESTVIESGNENDLEELRVRMDSLHDIKDFSDHYVSCSEESENEETDSETTLSQFLDPSEVLSSIEPMFSESPKIKNRKSMLNVSENSPRSKMFDGSTESLAASLHKGLEIIDHHQKSTLDRSSVSFSFKNMALKASPIVDNGNAISTEASISKTRQSSDMPSVYFLCRNCQRGEIVASSEVKGCMKTWNVEAKNDSSYDLKKKLQTWNGNENHDLEVIKEECEQNQVNDTPSVEETGKEDLLKEIACLRSQLQTRNAGSTGKSTDRIRSSLLAQSIQLRKSGVFSQGSNKKEDIEKERERWTEMESEWICLTDELRIDIETQRQRTEKAEMELRLAKEFTDELDDALKRSIHGQTTILEQYAELQEMYNELAGKHQALTVAVADIKRAAAKAGAKSRHGSRYAKTLVAELSSARIEREREIESLKKENTSLKLQVSDTVEAVHAAGELLVRLREAEETASVAEGNLTYMQEKNEKLKKEVEKLKGKHKTEMMTMKQYLAASRLPQSVLQQPFYKEDFDAEQNIPDVDVSAEDDDDQAWRAEFGAIYQEQHYGKW